jgi:glucose/arabinose dehydrogenase
MRRLAVRPDTFVHRHGAARRHGVLHATLARACLAAAALLLAAPPSASAVQFGAVQTLRSGIGPCAALAVGPEDPDPLQTGDGCVYAVSAFSGAVVRVCFDATKTVTASTTVVDLNGPSSVNALLGIAFDPRSNPLDEMHLYLAYADDNAAPFEGKIARAVSTDGGLTYTVDEDFITGLPRSAFDHQTNGLAFGPDDCLYVTQGNASNAGYDAAFAESRLSGAVLRACFKDGAGGVDPAFDRDCGSGNTQSPCSIEVYASGLRNPFDLVWHSNGRLYATDNDVNPGYRDNCAAPANTFGCPCQLAAATPIGDELNLIEPGRYYGSPNPYRANPAGLQCQGGSDGTDACTSSAECGLGGSCESLADLCTDAICDADVQCYYFGNGDPPMPGEDPTGLYREPIAQVAALLDGMVEYGAPFAALRPDAFCSDWDGDVLVAGGPGPVRRFELSPDGLAAVHAGTGNLGGLSGLDVAVGPDGTVYVADLNGGRVTYAAPLTQPDPGASDYFQPCLPDERCVDGACVQAADGDGDGFLAFEDCDDNDATVHPGAPEQCNDRDDDCDLQIDEGNPGGGAACTVPGQAGACAESTTQCQDGALHCPQVVLPSPELCNMVDDDCDGATDEGNPGGGASCETGEPGACAVGTGQCQGGVLACVAPAPGIELCATGMDENCDGAVDEVSCAPCLPANTVAAAEQTRRTTAKVRPGADGRDKLRTKGRFTLTQAGLIDPTTQEVVLRLQDGAGAAFYEGSLPAGSFAANRTGRVFTFKDPTKPYEASGLKRAKIVVAGDQLSVRYAFKAEGLDLPSFVPGTGTAAVRVGDRCFVDTADVCVLSASGGVTCR